MFMKVLILVPGINLLFHICEEIEKESREDY
jgi:hypothetical protein